MSRKSGSFDPGCLHSPLSDELRKRPFWKPLLELHQPLVVRDLAVGTDRHARTRIHSPEVVCSETGRKKETEPSHPLSQSCSRSPGPSESGFQIGVEERNRTKRMIAINTVDADKQSPLGMKVQVDEMMKKEGKRREQDGKTLPM
ncbi:hypothetical protein CC2G_013152 [Coprinopsis cinerea AmutBmut pab1-1]|nr:hypothetical protein CC2G_013152 [Coprinopsis cinerea AmutBmut pab1-1]